MRASEKAPPHGPPTHASSVAALMPRYALVDTPGAPTQKSHPTDAAAEPLERASNGLIIAQPTPRAPSSDCRQRASPSSEPLAAAACARAAEARPDVGQRRACAHHAGDEICSGKGEAAPPAKPPVA